MACCSSVGAALEGQFGTKRAMADLAKYRAKGAGATARLLVAGLERAGPIEGRLLDVGSGVGALSFELLDRGLTGAVGVDLSSAYVSAATDEARRRGRSGAVEFIHGEFVEIADRIPAADVVALDRVICCYPDAEHLLEASIRRANRYLALSYPRDVWYVRSWVRIQNLARQAAGNPFRTFVHSVPAMQASIRRNGFELLNCSSTGTWCVDVYRRA